MPGFLNTATNFRVNYRTPIEKQNDLTKRKQLANRVGPFLLRRTKNEVAVDLPLKTEITRTVQFDTKQAALYESIRLAMDKKIKDAIKTKGLAKSHILILDALLKLRQTCCDPRLLKLDKAKSIKESAKLELLMEMIPELLEEGRRILLFSQFTSMLELIEDEFKKKEISYVKLTGETIHRDKVIDEFKSGKANVFMISLKAGGFGLNLTEADTVIHYDPWWNPAVENQATDRAHRIGQDKPVFVYRLIAENTLEEKILLMQSRKKAIAESVYNDETGEQTIGLTAKEIESLFAPAEKK
jgi:SNF2 family DNA or RNA helicase